MIDPHRNGALEEVCGMVWMEDVKERVQKTGIDEKQKKYLYEKIKGK